MKILPFLLVFTLVLSSCKKDINFDSIKYYYAAFGSDSYSLRIKNDRTFTLEISQSPLETEYPKTESFSGTIDDDEMKHIQNALNHLVSKNYQYNDPKMVTDKPFVEVNITEGKSIRTYRTNNPTTEYEKDVIKFFNEICAKTKH